MHQHQSLYSQGGKEKHVDVAEDYTVMKAMKTKEAGRNEKEPTVL